MWEGIRPAWKRWVISSTYKGGNWVFSFSKRGQCRIQCWTFNFNWILELIYWIVLLTYWVLRYYNEFVSLQIFIILNILLTSFLFFFSFFLFLSHKKSYHIYIFVLFLVVGLGLRYPLNFFQWEYLVIYIVRILRLMLG